jgi:hypothetical protein
MNRSLTAFALALLLGGAGARAQVIEWDVNGSGGGEMVAGGFYMNGTVSQTADILATAGGFEMGQGFWYRAGARPQLATAVAGIQWYVMAGGGVQDAANALFKLNGTVSQTADILASAGGTDLGQGFWYGEPDLPLYKIREEQIEPDVVDEGSGGGAVSGRSRAARASMSIAPNPVAGYARIQVWLPAASDVTIEIFDAAGNSLGNAFAGSRGAGEGEIYFDGASLAAGAYFVRMQADNDVITRKITIVR